ncbi:HigA family addiction module antitoxin [Micavibrio aeruginosavorus]|uniref:Addiction module antidote protein, HigA family n=1 Tax=Micavibrio aeruginosavorus (strain ARL-13) TaxID=856793 RepID=G2KT79_MICAA|nr:HigA family addiction module antitoxin [Micavibrio aeruginosavorus]AEP10623.1 addiction module antidote protein, HigA family [Micavibrio aeruginosavorus ARL-13]
MTTHLKNPHPGDILAVEFLEPLGLSQNALAKAIDVPANRINEIIRGRRGITADTDVRLARYFGLSEGFFLRLQNAYDLMEAHRAIPATELRRIKPHAQACA